MGDSGAYVTNNFFPSPLHRASVVRMNAARGATRISTPFFLRGKDDVIMTPRDVAGAPLPPLRVQQLDDNQNGCRDRTPWKMSNEYYAEMMYSE